MCGIVGYIGNKRAAPVLLRGLKRLEYRGYDSAGIAVMNNGKVNVVKKKGRVKELDSAIEIEGTVGIGHTRWATHGAPSEKNAHPHTFGKFTVVHNGIIENFLILKKECLERGETFLSETDSEVIAHLLNYCYCGDFLETVKTVSSQLKGSFALSVLCSDYPNVIIAVREKSPLVIGKGTDGIVIASDIPAAVAESDEVYSLADGEFAVCTCSDVKFYNEKGEITKHGLALDRLTENPDHTGFAHYMQKEMAEIPAAIANSLTDFHSNLRFSDFCEVLCQTEYIQIIACGTAYHSGIAAKYAIESLARIPVETEIASEYRYRDPIVKKNTLVLAISQSGETADTLAAAQLAKEKGAIVAAITNAPYSSLTQNADFVLETRAGREIAVAATKSYNAQLALLYSLAVALARAKGKSVDFSSLQRLPTLSGEALSASERVHAFAKAFAKAKSVYFIGRGADYCSALEGSLKLKEISYLPSEGYPAGELKHGTLALIEEGTPVVAILTQKALTEKTLNAASEVYARGGKVFLVTTFPEFAERKEIYASIVLPKCEEVFSPILSVIPLQMLAYYTALARGNDPDKPRNLAKSVTVE